MNDNAISEQLLNAELELNTLRQLFAEFCQVVEESRTVSTYLIDQLQSIFTDETPADVVMAAVRAIHRSIETLQDSFDAACGGESIDWSTWWSLAADTEKHMGSTIKYSNSYGTVGGTATFLAGEGKEGAKDALAAAKEALPSESKLWVAAFMFIAVLVLILFIKLS